MNDEDVMMEMLKVRFDYIKLRDAMKELIELHDDAVFINGRDDNEKVDKCLQNCKSILSRINK